MPSKEEIEEAKRHCKKVLEADPLKGTIDFDYCDVDILIAGIEQLEVEKTEREKTNDKYLQKLVYALSPTNHLLDNYYNRSFKKIIAENIDLETDKIKKMLKDCWEGRY
mgnify:CR=1 FL=1